MRTIPVSFALLFALSAHAGNLAVLIGGPPPSAGPSYLIKQGFEGTGYDNSETWTEVNNPNEDYTTTVLDGSQSLFLDASGGTGRGATTSYTGQANVYVYLLLRFPKIPEAAASATIKIQNSGGTLLYQLLVSSTGGLQMQDAGDYRGSAIAGAFSADTTYHVWMRYQKGTGSNAELELAFSTDGTKPTSGANYRLATNGSGTTDAAKLQLFADGSAAKPIVIFDKIRVSASPIGDSPE